jgi:hypothetical protein
VTQFGDGQRAQALDLVEKMAWVDMDNYIRDLENALRLALEATADDFWRWEDDLGPKLEAEGFDEFSLPVTVIEELSSEERLAYSARLLRSLALSYGVSAEFGGAENGLVGEADLDSPAGLLRGLNDIVWIRPRQTETRPEEGAAGNAPPPAKSKGRAVGTPPRGAERDAPRNRAEGGVGHPPEPRSDGRDSAGGRHRG